jgi:putative tricarboxylic transport membrane protein
MLLATIGVESVYGAVRYDFVDALRVGVEWVIVLIGIYALGEVICRFANGFCGTVDQQPGSVRTTIPSPRAILQRSGSLGRGTLLGSVIGTVPGAGATVGSFIAYGLEKQFGRYRREVGEASPSGVVAPQAAATATVAAAFIPLLVLGIPGSASTAVILGALLLHNVRPSPLIFTTQPELVYTIMGALFVGLFLMFIIGILAAKPLIRMLRVPEQYVAAFVVLFAFIGAFALRNSMADVWIMTGFAVLGFFMLRNGYPLAPLVLGTILGPLAERYFMTSMISFDNDWTVFFTRPLSGTLMWIWVVVLVLLCIRVYRQSQHPPPPAEERAVAGDV